MIDTANTLKTQKLFYTVFLLLAALGIYLRFDQFTLQVLLDDEWHVIHQLLARSPAELATTLGVADFSIPLALLYWVEAQWFGLSELAMRWPMMLAGIVFLCLAPLYVRRHFDERVALVFMFLLAVSPRLIVYSQTARPYAVTLFLSFLAVIAFHKFVESDSSRMKWAAIYVPCAVACAWLHLVTLPVVVAPFAVFGIAALAGGDRNRIRRMFYLGLITLALMLLLLLPPLWSQPEDLAIKLGADLPGISAFYGMLFAWAGTGSTLLVLISMLLAATGAADTWRKLPLTPSLLSGLALTLGLILATQPAWVQFPITLTRYLLVALPLFLLALAAGLIRAHDIHAEHWGKTGQTVSLIVMVCLLLAWAVSSPLPRFLSRPNSNLLHAVYQFDFRDRHNLVRQYQQSLPVSPVWKRLTGFPADSIKVAVAPFSFESHHWNAARWEQLSRQRVMPGYLIALCGDTRWGEVPDNQRFNFTNAGYLADPAGMRRRGFDLLVYQKPASFAGLELSPEIDLTAPACEQRIRFLYHDPVYEDEWVVVFALDEALGDSLRAER
jgi:hypothetical protein